MAYGMDPPASPNLNCIAQEGRTYEVYFAQNPAELAQVLQGIFVTAAQP